MGATSFCGGVLRLAPLVKEHDFAFVDRAFPDLLRRYQRACPSSDAPRDCRNRLDARIARVKERYGFGGITDESASIDKSAAGSHLAVTPSVPSQLALAMPGL
jgi:hypothetical protein